MKLQLHRSLLSYIRNCPFIDDFTVPAMFDDAGRKKHTYDYNMPDILHIFLTLKISAHEVFENHLYTCSVITVQDDFQSVADVLFSVFHYTRSIE